MASATAARTWGDQRIYKAAVDALGYKAIVGAGSTIYINDVEPVSGVS